RATRTTLESAAWDRIVPDPGLIATPEYAQVAVVDRGDGIRREDLRRLFVAFQQLDGSSTRRQGGTGPGLAVSARLGAAMNGHIAVRSTPGRGSTFAFLLPLAEEHGGGRATEDGARTSSRSASSLALRASA